MGHGLPLALAAGLAGPAAAQDCRLALVLAIDVSSSVDEDEDRLQRDGLAAALTSPEVVRAALEGDPVAIHAFEWSGMRAQQPLLPGWVMIRSEADLRAVASAIADSPRAFVSLPTAVGPALGYAADLLRDGPPCRRRTIDVAGDGIANEGVQPRMAYDIFPLDGVTVNALVVGGAPGSGQDRREVGARLLAWYQTEVIRGPGAFTLVAEGYEDYARAIELKLEREFELPAVSARERAGPSPS